MHDRPTPKGGGVGIVVAFLVGIAVLYRFAAFARLADPYFLGVIEASVAIAVVAFLDDLYDWPFTVKLGAQVLAALVAVGSGLYVRDYRHPLCRPALRRLGRRAGDAGLDPVHHQRDELHRRPERAGQRRLADRLPVPGVHRRAARRLVRLFRGRCCWPPGWLGFLPFNFPRARIFMGDVGSQFCGFMLAVLAWSASRFDGVELSFLLVPMLLSGVLFDVGVHPGAARAGRRAADRSRIADICIRWRSVPACPAVTVRWSIGGSPPLAVSAACCSLRRLRR